MHVSGVKVPKLGSIQDKIFRQYLEKESEKEVSKTHLLALLVTNVIPFNDNSAAKEWEQKIKKIWSQYLGLEYGVEIPEHTEKETQMMEYYQSKVKNLRPKLTMNKDKKLTVLGLDSLKT